jgi:N-acetylglucosamine-6-phosphate deacetylase
MEASDYLLFNARLVLRDRIIEGGALLVRNGRIESVLEKGNPSSVSLPAGLPRIDAQGDLVTPGLIEVHIHGAGGIGFDALGTDPREAARRLGEARSFLRARGITTFLPTLIPREAEIGALAAALEAGSFDEADLPGIYVEGPFIATAKRGGIPAEFIRAPDPAILARILALSRGHLRLMTVAPELPGAEGIYEALQAAGVTVCLGHSDCSLDKAAIPGGRFSITHLFNAMSPFSHRHGGAGLAMLPFLRDLPFVELNSDGVHVSDEALLAASRAISPESLILVSDAVVAAGLSFGDYSFFGMRVVSNERGVRYAGSGTLMGSNHLAPEVLRHWIRATGASLPEAVASLSAVPARLLGLENRRGEIATGRDASLVVWTGQFEAARLVLGT